MKRHDYDFIVAARVRTIQSARDCSNVGVDHFRRVRETLAMFAEELVPDLEKDNPNFNAAKFRKAMGVPDVKSSPA